MALKVTTVGSGSWGTAIANVFADAGNNVQLWGRDEQVLSAINASHQNSRYLPSCSLSPKLRGVLNLQQAIEESELIVCSIPTQEIRSVFEPLKGLLKNKVVVNTAKGLEVGTGMRVSQIFQSLCTGARYAVLSGPSFALEVAQRQPTAVTIGSAEKEIAVLVQKAVSNSYFRAYTASDVIGVELAGALKNVVALASGIVRGTQFGFNAQAAVITRGLAEIVRMGKKLGADPTTFLGLAGMGDLLLTCTGPLSRNLRAGMLLGQGKPLEETVRALGGVAEGVFTAQSAYELARKNQIDMPILNEIYAMLYQGKKLSVAAAALMGRDLKEENT